MNRIYILVFVFLMASWSFAQQADDKEKSEKKPRRLILDSQNYKPEATQPQMQTQVEVEAEEYPGLNITFENPAASMSSYKPFTKQELRAYSDLLLDYKLTDYDRTETARPHKPARLFSVSVPDSDSD